MDMKYETEPVNLFPFSPHHTKCYIYDINADKIKTTFTQLTSVSNG